MKTILACIELRHFKAIFLVVGSHNINPKLYEPIIMSSINSHKKSIKNPEVQWGKREYLRVQIKDTFGTVTRGSECEKYNIFFDQENILF